ncbi:hypothetical protein EV426DRAFT_700035 [Tirmania nivea]|nr:hypothetical protein EV426DRAFT_700035 [Tirmania nivea]
MVGYHRRRAPTTTLTNPAKGRNSKTRAATDKRTAPGDSPRRPQQEYLPRPWGNNHLEPFPSLEASSALLLSALTQTYLGRALVQDSVESTRTRTQPRNLHPMASKIIPTPRRHQTQLDRQPRHFAATNPDHQHAE